MLRSFHQFLLRVVFFAQFLKAHFNLDGRLFQPAVAVSERHGIREICGFDRIRGVNPQFNQAGVAHRHDVETAAEDLKRLFLRHGFRPADLPLGHQLFLGHCAIADLLRPHDFHLVHLENRVVTARRLGVKNLNRHLLAFDLHAHAGVVDARQRKRHRRRRQQHQQKDAEDNGFAQLDDAPIIKKMYLCLFRHNDNQLAPRSGTQSSLTLQS